MIEERNKEKVGSLYRDVWDQFKKHKGALFGGVVFLLIVISVIVGPFLWPFEANAIDIRSRNQGPSFMHPFGTDQLGRDTLARMLAEVGLRCRWSMCHGPYYFSRNLYWGYCRFL